MKEKCPPNCTSGDFVSCPQPPEEHRRCQKRLRQLRIQWSLLVLFLTAALVLSFSACTSPVPFPSPTASSTIPPLPTPSSPPTAPLATGLAQETGAQPEVTVNQLRWQVEEATLTKDLPSSYSVSGPPKGVYLVLTLTTRSLAWNATPPSYQQLVLLDQDWALYDSVASHGLFLTLLDPKRIATLLDPEGPPYQSSAVFDVPQANHEFVLGIKSNAHDLRPAAYLALPPLSTWP